MLTSQIIYHKLSYEKYGAIILLQMDELVERMCSADVGIPIKTEKSFRTRTPSVFTGK